MFTNKCRVSALFGLVQEMGLEPIFDNTGLLISLGFPHLVGNSVGKSSNFTHENDNTFLQRKKDPHGNEGLFA